MESKDWTQSTVKERLIHFLSYLNMGRNKFESSVGVSNGYITKLSGDITLGLAKRICSTYPELNREWLAWGEGEMLSGKSTSEQKLSPVEQYLVNTGRLPEDFPGTSKPDNTSETSTLKALLEQKENENTFLRTLLTNLTTNISNQVK